MRSISFEMVTRPVSLKNWESSDWTLFYVAEALRWGSVRLEMSGLVVKLQGDLQRRGKYRLKEKDTESLRYECFCSRQYFSYAAIWHHIKKSHNDFHRNNKHFSSTNMILTEDPIHHFPIKKLLRERVRFCSKEKKKQEEEANSTAPQPQQNGNRQRQVGDEKRINDSIIKILQTKLNGVLLDQQVQTRRLCLIEKQSKKQEEIIEKQARIIETYQEIFRVLNIKPINQHIQPAEKTNKVDEVSDDDQDYIPQ